MRVSALVRVVVDVAEPTASQVREALTALGLASVSVIDVAPEKSRWVRLTGVRRGAEAKLVAETADRVTYEYSNGSQYNVPRAWFARAFRRAT